MKTINTIIIEMHENIKKINAASDKPYKGSCKDIFNISEDLLFQIKSLQNKTDEINRGE